MKINPQTRPLAQKVLLSGVSDFIGLKEVERP
jgi:hypothetical protein